MPYGWQEKGKQLRIPSVKSKRINVLGFMNRSCELFHYPVVGSVNSDTVIAAFDDFAEKMADEKYSSNDRYTVVMVDNASIHTSKKFCARIDDWMIEKKLLVCFLPTYSPELNLIEILWRKIKYEWLNLLSIKSFAEFEKEVERVLFSFGEEYMISFSNTVPTGWLNYSKAIYTLLIASSSGNKKGLKHEATAPWKMVDCKKKEEVS